MSTFSLQMLRALFLATILAGALAGSAMAQAAAPPDNMREIWSPWEKAHTVRTILALAAFVLEVVALCIFA